MEGATDGHFLFGRNLATRQLNICAWFLPQQTCSLLMLHPYPDLDARRTKLFKLKNKLFVTKMLLLLPSIATLVLDQ